MPDRDYYINGESMVMVKGGEHTAEFDVFDISQVSELGLTSEAIRITPRWIHEDIHIDDFGPDIPADVMSRLAEVTVRAPFIHFDHDILNSCLAESMGGIAVDPDDFSPLGVAGTLPPAGTLHGGWIPLHASGCHYISMGILSPQLNRPWTLLNGYMTGPPVEIPLGTEKSVFMTNWRFVPYVAPTITELGDLTIVSEITSSGSVLWNHEKLE